MRKRPAAVALTATLCLMSAGGAWGHGRADVDPALLGDRPIRFPDVAGYRTLVADLHSHSVFSDGHVWPKIRIEEALRDGLDAFAVTEHLEYQPHLADIPHADRNRSYQEAMRAAEGSELIVIAGSEITRELPAGHINAVFIEDANGLYQVPQPPADPADTGAYYRAAGLWPPEAAVAAANAQGAFVFINHPYWTRQRPSGVAELSELHRQLIDAEQLHGIEVANGDTFSAEALEIGLQNDLTLLGVSDIHDLIDWDFPPAAGAHRPVTLVFATERSADAIRSALFERRTVVWFKNLLIGREPQLLPLLEASLEATDVRFLPGTDTLSVTLFNHSDASFELRNASGITMVEHDERFTVPPLGTTTITLKPGARTETLAFPLEVENALLAPGRHPTLTLALKPG
ncbi:MAG: Sb-PDE family phosphodiesterase [Pseudomonadales bacterium]